MLTCPSLSLLGETATIDATAATPEEETPATEAAPAEGPAPPTTAAAADPVAKTAMSMRIRPAGATATVSARIATRDGTAAEETGPTEVTEATVATAARGNGTVTGAPGPGGMMERGGIVAQTAI